MEDHFALLGMVVRDRVTCFKGVATSICFDLYGCVQVAVYAQVAPYKPNELAEGRWFDEKRLELVSTEPVMPVPTFESIPGPSEKPSFARSPLG